MDQHHCPEDAPSSWNLKADAGSLVTCPTARLSHRTRPELTSKTPSPLPRCSRGSRKTGGRLWEKRKRTTVCLQSANVKHSRFHGRCSVSKPAEGLGGGSVVQGSTADLVRLIDLSASAHQGHSALIPPVSSRVVQWCPGTGMIGRNEFNPLLIT